MHTADPLTFGQSREQLDRAAIREAAQWLVRLNESAHDPQLVAELALWRVRSKQHELAWCRAQQVNDKFGLVPRQRVMSVLTERSELSRRRAIRSLVLLMTVFPTGVAGYQVLPWREWQADYRTRTGQQRALTLNDGSELTLNTDTALDVQFDRHQRLIRLHRGELLIDSGADPLQTPDSQRPLRVLTRHGGVRALGTRFVVRQQREYTLVQVFDGVVEIEPRSGGRRPQIQAGQQLRFGSRSAGLPQPVDPHGADWAAGLLVADRLPLGRFLAELGRYRPGLLRCDESIASLPVSGAFQLSNTDQVLASLPCSLPVKVVYRTRYWVSISVDPLRSPGGYQHAI
ncbi:FecR domain-containing protein [Halopseudomonas maritima]|uniref:FecR domain-containing protein n=1 Tax=Halopseudomonas maritima TaxID=2918528 RepID=UPI001EEC98F4|nr:FecR domain-containing protein [Halopseudomonas maritima]UJJ31679.1 FecR domain-containing protein [Halopseudomonas maritima]